MMRINGLNALLSVWVLGALIGCGDGDEDALMTQELTAEEAAHLAEFRTRRDAGDSAERGAEAESMGVSENDGDVSNDRGHGVAAHSPERAVESAGDRGGSAAVSSPLTPTVFREYHVTDPGLNNMVASTVLVPEKWQVEGGITRPAPQYYTMPILNDIKFIAPNGRQAHFFPSLSFEFNAQQHAEPFSPTLNGNMVYPLPESPGQWIMELARSQPDPSVSNLKLISEEPDVTLTEQLQQQAAPIYQMIQEGQYMAMQTGVDMAFDTQATVIKLQYTQNGVDLEESILMTWQYFINLWNGQVTGGNWSIGLMVSARGPVGSDYGNDPELMALFRSLRVNPQWQAEMNKYWAELARIRQKGADQRNRDWQAHNAKMQQIRNETSDIIANGYASRTAIRDAGHAKQMDAVREVTPYQLPSGQTVKIPDYYDNVHTDGNGRFILSNDMNYNPDRDLNLTGNWSRIEPVR